MNALVLLIMMLSVDDREFVGPPEPATSKPEVRAMADDLQTLRMRIEHNMKAVDELLRRNDVHRSRELQDDILTDLDKLLQQLQSSPNSDGPPPPPPAGPPPSNDPIPDDSKTNQGQGPSGGSRMKGEQPPGRPQPGGSRRERRSEKSQAATNDRNADQANARPGNTGGQDDPTKSRPGPRPGDADGAPGANPDLARGATMSPGNMGPPDKLADVARDVWGHLPDAMRQEVDHYYRERFMPRYRELLQQYYMRLAETDHRTKEKK